MRDDAKTGRGEERGGMRDDAKTGRGEERGGPRLNVLDGEAAPAGLGAELAGLLTLPEAARDSLGELVQQVLSAPPDDRLQTRLKRLSRDLDIAPEKLAPPLEACAVLLRGAAKLNTRQAAYLADVRALATDESFGALSELLLPLYEQLFPALRKELMMRSITAHGNVVQDIDWRFDVIKASRHALAIEAPLTSLTFAYQEGSTARRITLQLLPYQLRQLRDICLEVVGEGPLDGPLDGD